MLNANKFCENVFNEDYIYDYMQNIFIKIAAKQFNSEDIYLKYKKYKIQEK